MSETYSEIDAENKAREKQKHEVMQQVRKIAGRRFYEQVKEFIENCDGNVTDLSIVDDKAGDFNAWPYESRKIKGYWDHWFIGNESYWGAYYIDLLDGRYLKMEYSS